ncbi:MAG: hypothetical protein ACP5NZ_02485 [Nanobdellota archaeon]
MNKVGAAMLLVVVLAIGFSYYYFIVKGPCEPVGRCSLNSVNMSCITSSDCYSSSIHGTCNLATSQCVDLTVEGDKEYCINIGGEWIEWGCLS